MSAVRPALRAVVVLPAATLSLVPALLPMMVVLPLPATLFVVPPVAALLWTMLLATPLSDDSSKLLAILAAILSATAESATGKTCRRFLAGGRFVGLLVRFLWTCGPAFVTGMGWPG